MHMGDGNDAEAVGKPLRARCKAKVWVVNPSRIPQPALGLLRWPRRCKTFHFSSCCMLCGRIGASLHIWVLFKDVSGFLLKNAMADHRAQEEAIKKSGWSM